MIEIQQACQPEHCRVVAQSPPAVIELSGITAAELAARFFSRSGAPPWAARSRAIHAAIQSQSCSKSSSTLQRFELEDGCVELTPAGPGRLRIQPHHREPESLLPRSLNLLLAQQWAQQGCAPLHAAAADFEGTGLLILGARGTGKSTLCMSLLAAGGRAVSDDWVLAGIAPHGQATVARLRNFMMLRAGESSRKLLAGLPWLSASATGCRPKRTIWIEHQTRVGAFAGAIGIDRLILLQRPRSVRQKRSRCSPAPPEQALAMLMQSAMPLLLSSRFAFEQERLMALFGQLVRSCAPLRIEPGTDLLDQPGQVISQWLSNRPAGADERWSREPKGDRDHAGKPDILSAL
ncbi:MAG: hypothetical protein ABR550_06630 [Wenzhouxiangellaceae bacterium]